MARANLDVVFFAKSLFNDSIGENYGYPVFSENGKSFTSKEITYNFNTKKGIIRDVRTQEGESYILGDKVKKNQNEINIVKKLDNSIKRRQDAPITYDMNASIYIWKRNALMSSNNSTNPKNRTYLCLKILFNFFMCK